MPGQPRERFDRIFLELEHAGDDDRVETFVRGEGIRVAHRQRAGGKREARRYDDATLRRTRAVARDERQEFGHGCGHALDRQVVARRGTGACEQEPAARAEREGDAIEHEFVIDVAIAAQRALDSRRHEAPKTALLVFDRGHRKIRALATRAYPAALALKGDWKGSHAGDGSRAPRRPGAMSIPADLFEEDYSENPDPFHYEGNPFELIKYYAQLALLTDRRYASALELGSSIGIFTELLAPRCDRLLAVDCAPSAVAQVRARCAAMPHVTALAATVPDAFPDGTFDLVSFAEFGYYLDRSDLAKLRQRITAATAPGAHLIVSHMTIYLAPYMDWELPSTYEEVHEPYRTDPNWSHVARLVGNDVEEATSTGMYWCDLFERV